MLLPGAAEVVSKKQNLLPSKHCVEELVRMLNIFGEGFTTSLKLSSQAPVGPVNLYFTM